MEHFSVRTTEIFSGFFGENGTLNATRWSWDDPFTIEERDGKVTGSAPLGTSTHHMKNFFDCIKSREKPSADIDTGFGHRGGFPDGRKINS